MASIEVKIGPTYVRQNECTFCLFIANSISSCAGPPVLDSLFYSNIVER